MKLKRFFAAALSALLLAGAVAYLPGGHGAFAATTLEPAISEDDVTIYYDYDTIEIDESSYPIAKLDKEIYYTEVYSTDMTKWYTAKVGADGKAKFDISWAKTGADVKIYLRGDVNTRVISTTIKMQDVLSVKFYGSLLATDITDSEGWQNVYANYPNFGEDTGYLIFTKRVNNREMTYQDLDTIQWRKGTYGNWRDYNELDLKEIEIRGAVLEFRIKSNNADNATNYAGNRYSSTVKLSVAKIANAPTLTITMLDGTISIKNGMEFSTDGVHWILVPAYLGTSTSEDYLVTETDKTNVISPINTKVRVNKLLLQEVFGIKSSEDVTGGTIYVRTAGTDRIPASKIREIEIPSTSAFTAADMAKVTMEYVSSRTGNGGIQVNNANSFDLQVCVIAPTDAKRLGITLPALGTTLTTADFDDLPVTSLSWTTLKANSYTKITYSKAVTGSILVFRRGYTSTELPSPYQVYPDMVNYASAITFASISGQPKNGYTITAVPSSNLLGLPDSDFTFEWQYADSRNAADSDWTVFGSDVRQLDINNDVPAGQTQSLYQILNRKYVRVKISYNGTEAVSQAVGPVTGQ